MKKSYILVTLIATALLTACSKSSEKVEPEKPSSEAAPTETLIDNNEPVVDEPVVDDQNVTPPAEENQETLANTEESIEEKDTQPSPPTFVDSIPAEYLTRRYDNLGTINHISYPTKDYFGDGADITKNAYVYLPYGYDEAKSYNVLYLMHGIGGNEMEWGMVDNNSRVKIMMDNLIYNGEIEPFIIVAPNGRSSADFANTSSDHNSFYVFGQELRNDLIPYIDKNFATYGDYDENGYDMTASRDHRSMAGLSMGGMQTINIGLCDSLDLISSFGAFSAAPTTNPASQIATSLQNFPDYGIHYFYNICGLQDGIAIASSFAAVNSLTSLTDKLTDDNFTWQEVKGGHDFNIWYLGFYNFTRVAFLADKDS